MHLTGMEVLVVGLGKSGLAAIKLLVEKGAHPHGTDSRALAEVPGAGPFLHQLGVGFSVQSPELFERFPVIVISPGVAADLPELQAARARGARVLGDVELAHPYLRGPRIGITGSNGKTTTTALTGHLLKESNIDCQVGGNIGWPPADMVGTSSDRRWNVLELSSFQLETIDEFAVDISVVLNITPDHLDRHGTMDAYAAAKRRIVETQTRGHTVLNAGDALVAAFAKSTRASLCWFSVNNDLRHGVIHIAGEPLMPASEIPLRGLHNVENVLAAANAARLAGATGEQIRAAVRTFPGVEHRIEFVREARGVKYYNDSKATNVDATLKSIAAFSEKLWIILGGKDKGSDYRPLSEALRQQARGALLIGAAAEKIASQINGAVPLISCGTLESAVHTASQKASPGEVVLLAPACASFDQFRNYEERGKMFKTFVSQIVE